MVWLEPAEAPFRPIRPLSLVAYRIGLALARTAAEHAYGSTLAAGRWHSLRPGAVPRRVIYAASTRALAQLEKRVHANGYAPVGQALFRVTLPADVQLATAHAQGLPAHWRGAESVSQAFGDAWLDSGQALALWVPSYVEPEEHNLIINALHPRMGEVLFTAERDPFEFDPRLM